MTLRSITLFFPFRRKSLNLAFCSSEKFFFSMSSLNSSIGSSTISRRVRGHPGGTSVSCRRLFRVVDVGGVPSPARDPVGDISTDLGDDPE